MDASLTAGAAGLVGLLTGVVATLAFRLSERERRRTDDVPVPSPALPPGAAAVLSVLSSSAVVLSSDDVVVKASPAAHAYGLVRGDRLASTQLLDLVHETRRDGEIREAELDVPRGPVGTGVLSVAARVAPLGVGLVIVLVEDRTEAHRLDAVRRDFVANVSHELKTPVGALALLAEAVHGAADDPEAVRRFAGRMQQEGHRIGALVQDLLDLSRLEVDDPLRRPELVCVDEVVAEAVDRCRLAAGQKQIELVRVSDSGLRVVGDEGQLVTAVRNLVDNAVAYSPERTRVRVGACREGELVEISVSDEGAGIPAADLDRVFERFYRVDQARSRATGGTGLGLAIVKHVATNHGGDVRVWSVEGTGSTFTVRLPLAAVDAAAHPVARSAPRAIEREAAS